MLSLSDVKNKSTDSFYSLKKNTPIESDDDRFMSIIDDFLEAVDSKKGDQDVGAENIVDENTERTEIKDAELH